MCRNLIFDFDGTIADTSGLIVATMQKTIDDLHLPSRSDDEIKSTIGVRLHEIPSVLWPELPNLGKIVADTYRQNFDLLKTSVPVNLFRGVEETLFDLKKLGIDMAVATSRSHQSVEELTIKLGIREYFTMLLGGNDVLKGKPDPESIFKILGELAWNENETMMVGDMPVDVLMGKNAGLRTCGVTYGNGSEQDLIMAGADLIISRFQELKNFLL